MAYLKNALRIFGLSFGAIILTGIGLAYAQINVTGTNDTTGARSDNQTEVNSNQDWQFEFQNDSSIENDTFSDVNTGQNQADENTTIGGISTGSIDVLSRFTSPFMSSPINFGFGVNPARTISVTGGNSLTGANSVNENEVNANQSFDLTAQNNSSITNDAHLRANTGNNEADQNTTVAGFSTGDVTGTVSFDNSLGLNGLSTIDLSGISNGDTTADFSNALTGFNSRNENQLDANSSVSIDLLNNATIDNQFDACANTGGNDVSQNTSVGAVTTGNVSLDFSAIQ